MLPYIQKNLLAHEKLIYGVKPHWIIFNATFWVLLAALIVRVFTPAAFSGEIFDGYSLPGIVSSALLLVGIVWFIRAYIFFTTSEYGVTNRRVMIKIGWIQRNSLEIMLEKVEGVFVDQSVAGRVIGYGAITIIGTGGTKDRFPFIPDPLTFRRAVQQQIDLEDHPEDAKSATPQV